MTTLALTPLHAWHSANGGKMVPFAGYSMPVQYAAGVMKEHNHTRAAAGLFDVSHMGQASLIAADGKYETVAGALERLIPADAFTLKPGHQRYSQLLDENGGILDDLMFSRPSRSELGQINLIVNAACKSSDYAWISRQLPNGIALQVRDDLALIALQGPKAEDVLAEWYPEVRSLKFMQVGEATRDGHPIAIARSGYTGEDGFEISLPGSLALEFWSKIVRNPSVLPIGLGARDSLRLESGLCLYGNDIDVSTSPVEAALTWSIQKRRRIEGGFPGAARVLKELAEGPSRVRVGLKAEGRAPVRGGVQLFADAESQAAIGRVTSGGFGPSVNGPVAMGYVAKALSMPGTRIFGELRGERVPIGVVELPFVPNRFKR